LLPTAGHRELRPVAVPTESGRVTGRARQQRAGEPRRPDLRGALPVRRRRAPRREVIGLFIHPRRYPPARERRPPRLERVTKRPLGWLAERLARPLIRWDRARLETPEIAVPVAGLPAGLEGYRLALVTDLHHGRPCARATTWGRPDRGADR